MTSIGRLIGVVTLQEVCTKLLPVNWSTFPLVVHYRQPLSGIDARRISSRSYVIESGLMCGFIVRAIAYRIILSMI